MGGAGEGSPQYPLKADNGARRVRVQILASRLNEVNEGDEIWTGEGSGEKSFSRWGK